MQRNEKKDSFGRHGKMERWITSTRLVLQKKMGSLKRSPFKKLFNKNNNLF